MRWYKFLYAIVIAIVRVIFRVKIEGRENLPQGAAVVCANHTSLLDPVFIAMITGVREPMVFMGKVELFKIPVLGFLLRKIQAIPVDRGSTSMSTLREAIARLKENRKIMIFPEGTRVHGEAAVEGAKTGAALIACRANAPMVPVYLSPKKRLFGRVEVVIGKAFDTTVFEGSGSTKYKAVVEEVFGEILALGSGGVKNA